MILKPRKPATEATSYRPISLLPVLSNFFEKKKTTSEKIKTNGELISVRKHNYNCVLDGGIY